MKIALVDDDISQLQFLNKIISHELSEIEGLAIDTFESGEAFLGVWQEGLYDFIVLDIFMGGMTGLDVARTIRETDDHVKLAFCTSSNDFASESYEVDAHYYLHKPITEKNTVSMLKRLNLDKIEHARKITLPDGQALILRNILYTEYSNHIITITRKNDTPYRIRISHSEMEALLIPHKYFYSPSKGIILNFHEVEKLGDDSFTMSDGKILPISRRKIKETQTAYANFRLRAMRER